MLRAVKSAGRNDAAMSVHSAARRAERIDTIVAATLLVLLIFGWAIKLTPFDQWPRGDFQVAASTRHA